MSCTPLGDTQDGLDSVKVERSLGRDDDLLRSCGRELVALIEFAWVVGEHAALDARRVTADLLAPLVEHAALVREGRHRPEPGPHVGVLRGDSVGDAFPFAT